MATGLKKAIEAAFILWGKPAYESEPLPEIEHAGPTITPLPVALMELTIDEANSGEYDDWLDRQAQAFCVEQEFPQRWHWEH